MVAHVKIIERIMMPHVVYLRAFLLNYFEFVRDTMLR